MSTQLKTVLAFSAIFIVGVIGAGFNLSAVTADGTNTVLSYCGTPDYFNQFGDQYGYSPTAQCTGVQVEDYRIDVSVSDYSSGSWGCTADYTVYEIRNDGSLNKVADPAPTKDRIEISLDGLTVEGMTANSGLSFYNCEWVQTDYDVELPGKLSFDSSVPDSVERGDKATITVDARNHYGKGVVDGELGVKICGKGAFDERQCTTRTKDVSLGSGESGSYEFVVDTSRVGGELQVSTSFDGWLKGVVGGWSAVNLDCDGDSVIEPVSMCEGLRVEGDGDTVSVAVSDRGVVSRFEGLVSGVWNEVHVFWVNLFGKPVP